MLRKVLNIYRERERERDGKSKSFTLIELLIVVAIIGILAALIIVSVTTAAAKARDVKRQEDLRNIQKALEMYYTANGSYPSNGSTWWGADCANNGYGNHATSGSSGYVPNLAPLYISTLPLDPRGGTISCGVDTHGGCYLYESNGSDYKLLAYEVVETTLATQTNSLSQFYDPEGRSTSECSYALYTPGAKMW